MQASKTPLNSPVRDNDVAISRTGSDWTTGTRRYFDLVEQHFDEYNSLTPKHHPRKRVIVADIFHQLSARFVHKNKGEWFILNEAESLDKIKQRFWDEKRRRQREAAALSDALLSPPTIMAATTTGVNEAAASRGDPLMSPNDVAAMANDFNKASDESFERRSHTPPFVHPASNQMGTFGGDSAPALISTGGALPITGGDFLGQGHASAPDLTGTGGTLPITGGDFLGQGHASAPDLSDTGGTLPNTGDDFLGQGHASASNPTSGAPSLPALGHLEAAAQWKDLLRTADDHISEFDDIHQYAV